jgi:hypothetical protein
MLALSGLLALAAGASRMSVAVVRPAQEPGHRHAVLLLEATSAADLPSSWPSVLRAVHRHSHFV